MSWPYSTGERPPRPPPDYAKARVEHANELKNLAGQWGISWPPPLLNDGRIPGYELLQITRKVSSFTDHERHRMDRARFFRMLKECGYID
jgi:hypothetical protein